MKHNKRGKSRTSKRELVFKEREKYYREKGKYPTEKALEEITGVTRKTIRKYLKEITHVV